MSSKATNIMIDNDYSGTAYSTKVHAHRSILFDKRVNHHGKTIYLIVVYLATNYNCRITPALISKLTGMNRIKIKTQFRALHRAGYIKYDEVSFSMRVIKPKDDAGILPTSMLKNAKHKKTLDKKELPH